MKRVNIDRPATPSQKAHKQRGTPAAATMKFPKASDQDIVGLRESYAKQFAGKAGNPAAALPVREQNQMQRLYSGEKWIK